MGATPLLLRLVRGYYLATPAFLLADLLFGISIRTPFIDAIPWLKWAWYVGATGAGVAVWRWPRWTAHIGLAESGLDIVVLVLSVGVAYIQLAAGDAGAAAFTSEAVANLVLSALMLIVSYLAAQSQLTARRQRR